MLAEYSISGLLLNYLMSNLICVTLNNEQLQFMGSTSCGFVFHHNLIAVYDQCQENDANIFLIKYDN